MGICAVKGWGITGAKREAYSAEVVVELHAGKPVVRMWRSGDGSDGFGAMYQIFKADAYRGQRVQFSATLRAVDVADFVALCFRVDGPVSEGSKPYLAFDNMSERPIISGTTSWTRYACVLDVALEATALYISNILYGRGELFWSDVRFEVVDDSVPVTDMHGTYVLRSAPTNLDFSEA